MNPSTASRRVRHRISPVPEALEDRMVLSAGEGSTFAIMPGTVTTAGQISTLNFKIDPSLFSTSNRHGHIVIGIDIAAATPTSSTTNATTTPTVKPEVVSVTGANGHPIRVEHFHYNHKVAKASKLGNAMTSAGIVTSNVPATGQPANDSSLQVQGLNGTTGTYLVGFYLPGDIAGTGTVTKADLQTIRKDHGMTAENHNYSFDADVNRDGIINNQDYMLAKQDSGATTKVSPVASVNLDPASDPAANRTTQFSTVHFAGTVTPNASVTFVDQSGGGTSTVTANSTGAYSIIVPLVSGSNTFQVTTQDGFGQSISGAISPVVYSPPTK